MLSGSDFNAFSYLFVAPAVRSDRLTVSELNLYMRPFAHDVAEIYLQGIDDTDPTRWSTGVPLFVVYGRAPSQVDTFYGYILGVERNWGQTDWTPAYSRIMRVIAIGASYPTKEDLTTVYLNMSTAQIARVLAQSHYFDFDIPDTDWVWPTKTSSGQSEWTFLCELAKASGLIMYFHGTQLRMYDPLLPLRRGNTVVPRFYEKDSGLGQSVIEFSSDVTEVSSDEGRRKRTQVVRGVDSVTGQPIYASDSGPDPLLGQRSLAPPFTETVNDLVVTSQQEANTLLPARSTANRFYIRAKAKLTGDPRITQHSPVVVEGLGSRDSGIWQVLEATHHIQKRWYSTDVVLGRDSDFDNGLRPGLPDGVARSRFDPYAMPVNQNPPTVLSNGLWRAAWGSPMVPNAV